MNTLILKGDIVYAGAPGELRVFPDSYLLCEGERVAGVFGALPERYSGAEVLDFGGSIIIPGFCDLHLHAPQFPNLGLGLDMELLDWLNARTFPTEARFADGDFADRVCEAFAGELKRSATARACVFGTIHVPAALTLMERLEETGLRCFAGKVNMDRNSPDYYREESAEASLSATREWLEAAAGFKNTKPIITPRFVPSCTPELMEGLGELARQMSLPVQSHLCENLSEIEWVGSLHPECPNYTAVYQKFCMTGSSAVMAHCVHMSDAEVDIMQKSGTYVAHCPTSNTNLRSGIAPIRRFMDAGLNVGLGSDISGGHTLDMFEVVRGALAASRLRWRLCDGSGSALKASEAFYLATRGGGGFFGKAGAFDPGFFADALVIDDSRFFKSSGMTLEDRFERMIYLAGAGDVRAKFVSGERIF